jgi:hypothetical protein
VFLSLKKGAEKVLLCPLDEDRIQSACRLEGRMKTKPFAVLAAGALLLMVASPMFAHHGGVQYDKEHAVTVTGTVTEYLFTNPHVQIHFDVKDENGNVDKWVAETGSPQRLFRFGWNAKTLKPGDKITVTGAAFKDGRKVMSLIKLVGGGAPTLTVGADCGPAPAK